MRKYMKDTLKVKREDLIKLYKARAEEIDDTGLYEFHTNLMSRYIFTKKELDDKEKENVYLSEIDPLTRICNRSNFLRQLEREFQRAKRYNESFTLIIFDIDNFTRINEEFGYKLGDKVLKSIAELVSAEIRKTDIFARIGGEEFALLFTRTRMENTVPVIEKLRDKLGNAKLDSDLKFTCSFAITCFCEKYKDVRSLIIESYEYLQTAKKNGGNQIIVQK
jgi:diguanylate cyclase (GGDEF)-like protein